LTMYKFIKNGFQGGRTGSHMQLWWIRVVIHI